MKKLIGSERGSCLSGEEFKQQKLEEIGKVGEHHFGHWFRDKSSASGGRVPWLNSPFGAARTIVGLRVILEEVADASQSTEVSAHDRYLKGYKLIKQRDRQMANAFNDFRRSTAVMQLRMKLLTDVTASLCLLVCRRFLL